MSRRRLAAAAVALWAPLAAADIFSPGELARAHQSLEGLSNCTQCHPAGGQLSAETCLKCHTELKGRVAGGKGYHGRLAAERREKCEGCHHEHQGRAFALVAWGQGGKKAFDHRLTGWALEGAHAKEGCDACHVPKRIKDAAIKAMLEKQPGRQTHLGLPTACHPCHFDEHRGQVGTECQECHDAKAWKPAPEFDHAETNYPLKGKHRKVECKACHPALSDPDGKQAFPPAKSDAYLKWSPLDFRACTDCHKDPHQGRFGERCQSCHTVEGWRIVKSVSAERAFHEKTRFPLKGAHEDVDCRPCHGPYPGKPAKFKNLPFAACTDCHFDAHLAQLTLPRGQKAPRCDDCHTVDGFSPARYGLEAHAKTTWPLEGAHQVVGCRGCHPATASLKDRISAALKKQLKQQQRRELFSFAAFDLSLKTDRCDSCHKDVHAGQFEAPCKSCHAADTFRLERFDHAKTKFTLEGKHAEAACGKCHGAEPNGVVRYRPLPTTCSGCHEDVHAGQLSQGKPETDCARCHAPTGFKPSSFQHAPPFTDFLLDGKHQALKCEQCHPAVAAGAKDKTVRYRPLPRACEGCHADFHEGAFRGFAP